MSITITPIVTENPDPRELALFAEIDAKLGNTMVVFDSRALANRYVAHRATLGEHGIVVLAEDTRTRSGLCVLWRDPIPPADVDVRLGNCLWLLEETLAGRTPRPQPGRVVDLKEGGHL